MSFRLNPFKVMRAVGIVAIITYGVVLATGYKKSKVTTTESVTKEMKVRNKDFYNSKDYKNNLTLPKQVVENNNETVAKELKQTKPAETVDLQKDSVNSNSELLPPLEAGASWEVSAFVSRIYLPSSSGSPCPVSLFPNISTFLSQHLLYSVPHYNLYQSQFHSTHIYSFFLIISVPL